MSRSDLVFGRTSAMTFTQSFVTSVMSPSLRLNGDTAQIGERRPCPAIHGDCASANGHVTTPESTHNRFELLNPSVPPSLTSTDQGRIRVSWTPSSTSLKTRAALCLRIPTRGCGSFCMLAKTQAQSRSLPLRATTPGFAYFLEIGLSGRTEYPASSSQ